MPKITSPRSAPSLNSVHAPAKAKGPPAPSSRPRVFLDRLDGVKPVKDGWMARCPAHDDGQASLSVREAADRLLLCCHAGCENEVIVAAIGLPMAALYKDNPIVVAEYDYRDETGAVLFQVVRMDPKAFRQRRPDGKGWSWKLGDVRRVLYRLPELLAADPADPVWIVEGEKDADRLAGIGLVATTNAGGAGKWTAEYSASLRGRAVVIVPDDDAPGRAHADKVARALVGVAHSVKVLTLPTVPGGAK